jgi:hypothetical protein
MNRYLIGALGAIVALGVVNYLDYSRPVPCCDSFREGGLPFRFLREGGFGGTRNLLWGGLAGDIGAMALLGGLVWFVWDRVVRRPK